MKKNASHKWIHSLIFFLLIFSTITAQETERPKIGLVLSGGGAKGFAHVGVLKVLEEYNIPIDYIGGTSMGSIVGGLYSIGYSAQQIEDMILEEDWSVLFADAPKRNYMPFFEKKERDRYLIRFQIKDWKFKLPNYAITNSGVKRLFSELTVGYHEVDDFSKLPTPFLCVAVDLVTGKEVVLDSGYLPNAMSASMAIPGVFPSVDMDSMVLIDGGMRNNFPVDYVREMGADIIIGVDVGASLHKADELKSFTGIVDQLTSLLAYEKFEKNRADCDIYIKPDMSKYSASDFTQESALGLFAEGNTVAKAAEEQLVALEQLLAPYDFPKREVRNDSSVVKSIKSVEIYGSKLDDKVVLGMMNFKSDLKNGASLDELNVGLERLKSSTQFSSVDYFLKEDTINNSYILHLTLEDSENNTINFAANYNTQENVALLFNGTFNTLFLKNSRASFDIELSQVPAFEFNYNINRGSLPGLGFKTALQRRVMDNLVDGEYKGEADFSKFFVELNTNTIVKDYLTLGFGVRYEYFNVRDIKSNYPISKGRYDYLLYRFFFETDTRNDSYYPTKGLKYNVVADFVTDNGYELDGTFPSLIANLNMSQTFTPCSFYTFTPALYAQLELLSDEKIPFFYDSFVGGHNQYNGVVGQVPFWGLRWGELQTDNFAMIALENRFKVANKHYVYLNANVMLNSQTLYGLNEENVYGRFGMAVGYSYDSLLGPMEIYLSLANKGSVRTFVNIGYYF